MFRRLALDNSILLIQYAVGGLVPLLLIPHIVRSVGLSAFGGIAVGLAWANYGAVIVQYAFNLSGPHQLAQLSPADTTKAVVWRILSAKGVLLAAVLAGVLVAVVLGGASLRAPGRWLPLVALPLGAALNTGWHLQTEGRFAWVSGVSIVGAMTSLVIGFGLVRGGEPESVLFAAVALCVGPLIAGVGTLTLSALLLRRLPWPVGWRSPWRTLTDGWPLFASQFTAALYGSSGPIVIATLAGAEQAGAYSAIERLTTAVAGACLLTHTAAYPRLAALYQASRSEYWKLLGLVVRIYVALAGTVALLVAVLWSPFQRFVLGRVSSGHGSLVVAGLVWLVLAVFGTAVTGYLTVSGNSSRVLPLTLKLLVFSFVLGVPGVLVFGAWAWLGAVSAAQALVLVVAYRAWNERTAMT
jgi:O-antigen/teichoic acid export membrane protein